MEEKKAKISDLILLCHIIDDYEDFCNKLSGFLGKKYNRNKAYKLESLSKGGYALNFTKLKRFFDENRNIISVINNYIGINEFICSNYDQYGNEIGNLRYFYQYIKNNKKDLEKILELLIKLKKLKFENLILDENIDFKKETYEVDILSFTGNDVINYLDNMNMIESDNNIIKYQTLGSDYKMVLHTSFYGFSDYAREITLKNLLLDKSKLPKNLMKDYIYGEILKLKKENSKEEIKPVELKECEEEKHEESKKLIMIKK